MGVRWSNGTITAVINDASRGTIYRSMQTIRSVCNDVLEDGAETGRDIIGNTPSALVPGKTDRIDTGHMQASVRHDRMKRENPSKMVGAAGWTGTVEDYFKTQEEGGMSSGLRMGDRYITPMHMLVHMRLIMESDLHQRLRDEFGN